MQNKKINQFNLFQRFTSVFIVISFLLSSVCPPSIVQAQSITSATILNLPMPGTRVNMTAGYKPAMIAGMITHPDNPLEFDFIVDPGQSNLDDEAFNEESRKMIKYFLASLTTPEEEMWVNLSPYEGNRIIPTGLGVTEMGRDLLAQDYILKQLTASLMYPEEQLGGEFWERVQKKALALYGTTDIPMNTFNKVWIVPDKATVYQSGSSAFVLENHLKVMLEEDYVALKENLNSKKYGTDQVDANEAEVISGVTSDVIKEVLIPEIEYEVNRGKHFAKLRQISNAMVLATWYKQNLKESLLGYVYVDQNKTRGIDVDDKDVKQKIYNQYLDAFQKGVYNYIKEDYDPTTDQIIPRKYFSGGFVSDYRKVTQIINRDAIRQIPANVTNLVRTRVTSQAARFRSVTIGLVDVGAAAVQQALTTVEQQVASVTNNLSISSNNIRFQPIAVGADNAILGDSFERLAASLRSFDRSYMAGLYRKYVSSTSGESAEKPLVIGDNFKPSAQLTATERTELLGARDYATEIADNPDYLAAAQNVVLYANPMNGGLGTSVSRQSYIEQFAGRSELGAKGTDLFFNLNVSGFDSQGAQIDLPQQVSVTELKYIQALRSAGKYSNIVVQELVNEDSIGPMTAFLDETVYLFDRVDQRANAPKRTYRQIIQETQGIEIAPEMIQQGALPVIDLATNDLTDDFTAPGGHGQLGSMVLQEALTADLPADQVVIRAVFNGDGPNNSINEYIAGFMARENVPIVMISTTKTPLDKKGGLIGVETTDTGAVRAQMLELAQAESNGQEDLFTAMGLTTGERGGQYFNTNVAAVNYTALQPFLRELRDVIGEERFSEIITPDLIPNEKNKSGRKVIQLEGAMGSALLNLNGFVTTSTDTRVRGLMDKYGFDRLLNVVNADQANRSKFFTPIKFAWDHVLFSSTDHFTVDAQRGVLVNRNPTHLPGFGIMDSYYKDVMNSLNAFRGTSMLELEEINIAGQVQMPESTLRGRVAINNRSDQVVDLNRFADRIGTDSNGRLELNNSYIEISPAGDIARIEPIANVDISAEMDRAMLSDVEVDTLYRRVTNQRQNLREYFVDLTSAPDREQAEVRKVREISLLASVGSSIASLTDTSDATQVYNSLDRAEQIVIGKIADTLSVGTDIVINMAQQLNQEVTRASTEPIQSSILSFDQASDVFRTVTSQGDNRNNFIRLTQAEGVSQTDALIVRELSVLSDIGSKFPTTSTDYTRNYQSLDRGRKILVDNIAKTISVDTPTVMRMAQQTTRQANLYTALRTLRPVRMNPNQIARERQQGEVVAEKLHTVLSAQSSSSANFLRGGFNQPGYGVAAQAVNDGSHAIGSEGNQGYYVDQTEITRADGTPKSGQEVFVDTTNSMTEFFQRRAQRIGKPIKLVIKPGIGGQHTPFQGIADVFEVIAPDTGEVIGEYELGKDYEQAIASTLTRLGASWDQVAVIPSSKSGSTDETMMIFVDVFQAVMKNVADQQGLNGEVFANTTINYLNNVNIVNGQEVSGADLFKGFDFDQLVNQIAQQDSRVTRDNARNVMGTVLGNMFFETTDRPSASRLSAFIRNSGLDQVLGEDAPGFGAMFDNVGGRWTGDLHMMAFLAYHNLDANAYWQTRYDGIQAVREGRHQGVELASKIVDEQIKKIALVVPDEFFWAAKGNEQNFNESIWQSGFANLRAVKATKWQSQAKYYQASDAMVINLSDINLGENFNEFKLQSVDRDSGLQGLANEFGRLFTTFYGMTYTVGNRLIGRAITNAGLQAEDIDINDLNNPATQILQENLYLRQPFVELGKGLLETRLKGLQQNQQQWVQTGSRGVSPIVQAQQEIANQAEQRAVVSNVNGLKDITISDVDRLAQTITVARAEAAQSGRTFVPFLYLGGNDYVDLRDSLVDMGVEWVMQGTGDQHISYQQVLANPDRYLPFFVSFVPAQESFQQGSPAIGFAKSYLDQVSPNLVRDYFAQASYEALTTKEVGAAGGLGVFVRTTESPARIQEVKQAFERSFSKSIEVARDSAMLAMDEKDTNLVIDDVESSLRTLNIQNLDIETVREALIESDENQVFRSQYGFSASFSYRIDPSKFIQALSQKFNVSQAQVMEVLSRSDNAQVRLLVARANASVQIASVPNVSRPVTAPVVRDRQPETVDAATTSADFKKGGIDLNPQLLDLQIKRDDTGIPLPIQQQPIGDMNIDGFLPVIINVAPVTNLPLLLGLADTGDVPGELSFNSSPADHKARFENNDVAS